MSVTVDVRTEGGNSGSAGATSLAWNHTVAASANMLVGVGVVSSVGNNTISTFQWDAAGSPVALTREGRVNDSALVMWSELWGLKAPASGTKQVKITPTASSQIVGGSSSYSGVDQTTPWNVASPQSATGTPSAGTPQPSVAVTSAVGEMVIVVVGDDEQANDDLLVAGGGQTAICNDRLGAGQLSVAASDAAGASSVTMSYTGVSNTDPWAIIGGSLRAAPTGGGYVPPLPYALNVARNPLARARLTYAAYSIASASAPINITADVGSLTLTGFAPVIGISIVPSVGALTLAGLAPTVATPVNVTPAVGALTATGFAPSVVVNTIVLPGVGALTLSGFAPTVATPVNVTPNVGALILTGFAPTANSATNVAADVGQLTLTGFAPSVVVNNIATSGVGAVTLTGFAPSVVVGVSVLPGAGVGSLTGFSPTVTAPNNQTVASGVGALSLAGLAPSVDVSSNQAVVAGVGAVTLTGFAPSASVGVTVASGVGAVTLTGFAPTVSATQSVNVQADVGAIALAGFAPSVQGSAIVPDVPPTAGNTTGAVTRNIFPQARRRAQTVAPRSVPVYETFAPTVAVRRTFVVLIAVGSQRGEIIAHGFAPTVEISVQPITEPAITSTQPAPRTMQRIPSRVQTKPVPAAPITPVAPATPDAAIVTALIASLTDDPPKIDTPPSVLIPITLAPRRGRLAFTGHAPAVSFFAVAAPPAPISSSVDTMTADDEIGIIAALYFRLTHE